MISTSALFRSNATGRVLRGLGTGLKVGALVVFAGISVVTAQAQTSLADQPLFASPNVPGNLVLALSVEFPTAVTAADQSAYSTTKKYLGYFDPLKCYTYRTGVATYGNYFDPIGAASTSYSCAASTGRWSGNFLNWATMQAVDPFRWALTGGYRNIDDLTTTILEKAWAPSNQGSSSNNFPNKSITSNVANSTPFSSSNFYMHVVRCGNKMIFNQTSSSSVANDNCPTATAWNGDVAGTNSSTTYSVEVRVKVCASAALKEANCVQYGSNYKPEGLIQKYSSKIRYSAFGYLNDPAPTGPSNGSGTPRDGGVLRARMKFVGPTQPVPGSTPVSNAAPEWSSTTGIFATNPDSTDATNSSVTNSGVINYLNQFGRSAQAYKYYDPVSELYYAATRYLRGLGNISQYSDLTRFDERASTAAEVTAMKDGFPVISTWTDPILYSCQKNFVLGIGDTNTNQDKSLPGNTTYTTREPTGANRPSFGDTLDVIDATNKVGALEGIGTIGATNQYNTSNNSAYIAGMAYKFNTTDIRSDLVGTQTIATFWLDVLEGSSPGNMKEGPTGRNQFYLAAKYGGFTVPDGYSYDTRTAALPQSWWSTNGDTLGTTIGVRPDNFFVANQADKMVSGLEAAFAKISATLTAFTTSFSTSLPQVAQAGNSSFSSKFDANNWTGEITASSLSFDTTTGAPVVDSPEKWNFSAKLAAQLAGTGWDINRRVITWNGTTGVAFRSSGTSQITSTQLGTLDTSYVTSNDAANYLNYLRGDRMYEVDPATTSTTKVYRTRTKLIGDIVDSKARPVGPPSFPYSDTTNPAYSTFKSTWATRRTMVYVGSNDGMMHAINGALVTTATPAGTTPVLENDTLAGQEMFAYVPSALYSGPNATPNVDGLASLGNPAFAHHFMVNATPNVYDIDLTNTPNGSGVARPTSVTTADWRSVLIGGLGKGGKSYYAIDVTDPRGMGTGTEAAAAGKVLWEFSNSTVGMSGELGYTYGDPVVVKTRKYGWVVILPSGYNNADGKGYFLFVNPSTGALLEKVSTNVGSTTSDAGLAHANAFIVDSSDGTADSIYAGDLLGNLWRLDLTAATGSYPTPVKLATLTDRRTPGVAQPVTSRPSIEVHPTTKKRFVMVGTGRLLDQTDIASTQEQTFYAIVDGTNAQFNTTASLPTGISFPITRAILANDANALVGVNFNPATQMGWYEDLGIDATTTSPAHTGTGIAWRVTSDSTTLFGSVAFAATLPNGSACSPSGDSRVYARDYSSATTTVRSLVSNVLTPVLFVPVTGNVTDLRYLSVRGKATLISGTDTGTVGKIEINPLGNLQLRRLNWRELQTVD